MQSYTHRIRSASDYAYCKGYVSKQFIENKFSGMVEIISTIGIALAIIIAFIGILNFINAVVTPMISFWHLQKESMVERLREAE